MSQSDDPKPESHEPASTHAASLHDLDERWTVPWALVAETPSSGERAPLSWHGAAPEFTCGPFTIPKPMLYASAGPPAEPEASCVDSTLPLDAPDFDSAPPVPHWATYAGLTPQQRANYLQWLAAGRSMPLQDINYAFLYFYGLERRALIDRADPEEILRILMRLLRHYDEAPSFFSSASRLAAFLFATKGIEKLKPTWFDRLFVKRAVPLHADSISVALTWLYERGKPLPPTLAFEIARQDMRCPHSAAFREDNATFETRFTAAYTDRFGDGMMLQRAEKKQTWKYRPVNPCLQSWEHFSKLWSVTSTDVAAEQAQFAPLVAIWRECSEDGTPSPWVALVDEHISADGRVLVPIRALAPLAGLSMKTKGSLSLQYSLALTEAAAHSGFELLPNPPLLLRPYKWSERVAVVRRPERVHTGSESYYLAGALLLALGSAMAEVDGEVDHIEVLHVSEIVNSLYHFNDYDKHRLGVLRKRLLKYPPKLASLTRRVRAILSKEELSEVGKFLVGVAGANFHIAEDEQLALRRAYRAFGLPVAALDALLADLVGAPDQGGKYTINEGTLARYMRETKDFAARLGTAVQQLEIADRASADRGVWYTRKKAIADAPETSANERDPYRDALYALVQRTDWSEAEFIALGEQHGVFVAGAMRTSDAWAAVVGQYDGTDRMVLDSGDNDNGVMD